MIERSVTNPSGVVMMLYLGFGSREDFFDLMTRVVGHKARIYWLDGASRPCSASGIVGSVHMNPNETSVIFVDGESISFSWTSYGNISVLTRTIDIEYSFL